MQHKNKPTPQKNTTKKPISLTNLELAMSLVDRSLGQILTAGSNRKVEWKCKKGHFWIAKVLDRSKGSGCPFCSGKNVIPGVTSLSATHPNLSKELADPGLAQKISSGSGRKLTWKCKKGHSWEATVAHRAKNGSGCPFCAGRKVIPSENSLFATHPEIAIQLVDQSLGLTLLPGSAKKVSWLCKKGHIWEGEVRNRTHNGAGCNICAGKVVLRGFNDMATTNPELAAQLINPDDGYRFTVGTKQHLNWICKKGHKWSATGTSRFTKKSGCPYCSGNAVSVGETDMATTHPVLAKQLVETDPKTIKAGTSKKLLWKCEKGHEWKATGSARIRGNGCPICSRKKVLSGFNDMATTHPEIAKQLVGHDPKTLLVGTMKKLRWRCNKNHEWIATGNDRLTGYGCPVCFGIKVWPGYNDMATTHPELAKQLVGNDPKTVIAGTNKKLRWRCAKGHEWYASGNSRIIGNGCSVCANRTVIPGINDMATTHPWLASQLVGNDPKLIHAGTNKKLKWRCKNGHEWIATGSSRFGGHENKVTASKRRKGNGCPFCAGKAVSPGFNDLATTHPFLANQLIGTDPRTIVAGTGKLLKWRCKLGHEWTAKGSDRALKKSTCPFCSFKKCLPGFNDMATTHPELARQLINADPTKIMAGTPKPLNWRCDNGHTWKAPASRLWSGHGCPGCSKTGYDRTKAESTFYLISRPGAFKIGIMNPGTHRLKQHISKGWEEVDSILLSGESAANLELAIKRRLRLGGVKLGINAWREPFDGYTEAWPAVDLEVSSILELCSKLEIKLKEFLR